MEKERRITAPDGCEIAKVEIVDGVAVVTFKPQERRLPKSWEEFCKMYQIKDGECLIENYGEVEKHSIERYGIDRKWDNLLPDRATAEAVLALCQLLQLRDFYNGDWVPDWTSPETKFMIYFNDNGDLNSFYSSSLSDFLFFKNEKLCDEFLRNFLPLIEKLKPLYGIKEGGDK